MNFDELLNQYYEQFLSEAGKVELKKDENAREIFRKASIPNKPGVYLIYIQRENILKLIYVGHGGTLKSGLWTDQKLLGRLTNGKAKVENRKIPRPLWFKLLMEKYEVNSLIFQWFVTFGDKYQEEPEPIERKLREAFRSQTGYLPLENRI